MTCYDCLHKDVCYKIEHYGRSPEGEACKDFYHNTVELNDIDEALRKLDNISIKYDYGPNLTDDEIDYLAQWMKFYKSNPAQFLEDYFGVKLPKYQKILLHWIVGTSHL